MGCIALSTGTGNEESETQRHGGHGVRESRDSCVLSVPPCFKKEHTAIAQRLEFSAKETVKHLEDVLAKDLTILLQDLLLIGRHVPTAHGKFVDLAAIDCDGNLKVVEVKRDKTPREVVAQVLDDGSWVRDREDDDIGTIFDA